MRLINIYFRKIILKKIYLKICINQTIFEYHNALYTFH